MAFPERSEKIPGSENFFSGKIVTLNWLHGWSQVIRSFGECVIYIYFFFGVTIEYRTHLSFGWASFVTAKHHLFHIYHSHHF